MPSWRELMDECRLTGSGYDVVRRKYIDALSQHTQRNTIVYYSGWLQRGNWNSLALTGFEVNDADKNGFMAVIHKMDRSKGLDLILHTPGGSAAATESLVDYLRAMFGTNIRAIVPQLALSAGTMIAMACKVIIMGAHSSLGPIDPQIGGVAAHGIIEEFAKAIDEVQKVPHAAQLYAVILAKYQPTLIGEAQKAIVWSTEMATEWLKSGMLGDIGLSATEIEERAARIVSEFGDHALTKSHARHLSLKRSQDAGMVVESLEKDPELQERVLSVHHACIQTLEASPVVKLIENQLGVAYIQQSATQMLAVRG